MAYSWIDLVASGGQQNFAVPMGYLSRDHISVYINSVLTTAYTWNSSTIVRLDSGATNGDTIRIRRVTPIDEAIVDYSDGSLLGENDLDSSVLQALYNAQEVADSTTGVSLADDTIAAATAAAASAAAALASQTAAETAEGNASASADAAAASAAAAEAAAESAVSGLTDAVKGVVNMYRTGSGTWAVYAPDLSAIDISASNTDGLQEAIDYACTEGYDLHVHGGGIKPGSPATDIAVINCTVGIVFPPMQNKVIRIGACTVNFTGAVTGTGVFFDSCMMIDLDWCGQIVYTGNGRAVEFKPTSGVPYDAVVACVDSKFKFNHIALTGGTNPICLYFDTTNGPVQGCLFEGFEFNGIDVAGSRGIVLEIATNGIISNTFRVNRIHLCKSVALSIGTSTTGQANIHSNIFECMIYGATGGTTAGIDVFGQYNMFIGAILNNEGALTYGVHWESGASNNSFIIFRNNGTTAVQNDSGGATNKVNFA